jgi:hypothetical protein
MSDRDDDLVPLERNPVDLEARRYKFRRTKLLIHAADSPLGKQLQANPELHQK